ncbi:MAG: SUMF1/EgtB/PvdO family nonheme iron enzyme [Myxococcales bacterium]|nr:SUMF1/EgtB/PvdO family nonheme iron enzyme [Myxococcales bacterium]
MRARLIVLIAALASACGPEARSQETSASPATTQAGSAAPALASASATALTSDSAQAAPKDLPGRTDGCGEGMVRVEGDYCPAVMQDCEEHHQEYETDKEKRRVSERCLRYKDPSRCVSKKRKPLSFCMDRYEYPNRVGELPRVLTSWKNAKKLCEAAGKRLCTEDEFNFACEGPDMLPYLYGFVRDPKVCNFDKEYRYPDHSKQMLEYDECLLDAWCKAELDRLDQREKIGERTTCVAWSGVFDLNGNANEWVEIPGEKPPNRSGLKGGWWGPIRARCRPTVTFHKESDYGYEAGFRCCTDAKG